MKSSSTRTWFIVLAVIGLLDSVYLTIAKLTASRQMCLEGIGDCWSVNQSAYSEILGIPIALLGAAAYAALIVLVLLEQRAFFWRYITFAATLFGVLYSAYLTYIEIAVLKAICPFCVVSAVVITLLFALTIYRLFADQAQS